MTTILVLHDDRSVDEFEYGADVRSVSIGRRPSNDVCVPDRSVSGRHARLTVRDDGTWLEDLGSTNGTWLDGDSVTERRLEDGDEVVVGKIRLKIHTLDPWAEARSDARPAAGLEDESDDGADARRTPAASRRPPSRGSRTEPVPASAPEPLDDEDSFVEASLAAPVDDDDELDESMRRALELYEDDADESYPDEVPAATSVEDDDEPDFAEDARLFAQAAAGEPDEEPPARHREEPSAQRPERDADGSLSLTDRAKVALGRTPAARPRLHAVGSGATTRDAASGPRSSFDDAVPARGPAAFADDEAGPRDDRVDAFDDEPDNRDAAAVRRAPLPARRTADAGRVAGPLGPDGSGRTNAPPRGETQGRGPRRDDDERAPTHELDRPSPRSRGAVIQIKNGAKSGQILPIDKPVTTLGRPGIQIAAIMRKPDGYFLMHIESDDTVERPTLNSDSIGDEPVLLHSGDELNVAGIDVEFMLS